MMPNGSMMPDSEMDGYGGSGGGGGGYGSNAVSGNARGSERPDNQIGRAEMLMRLSLIHI